MPEMSISGLRVVGLGSGAGVTAGILICMPNKCFCFLCIPWCEKMLGNIVLDHGFSACTVIWICVNWEFYWNASSDSVVEDLGLKIPCFFFNKLLILVQGPHLNLWAPGDYICGSETLVFMRITWGMWIKCCFLGSTLQRFYVTVVGWGPGMCIFMSAHVIIMQVVSCQDFEKHCSRSQWNDN